MEVVIIALLGILVILVLWDRLQRRRILKEQGDTLTKVIGARLDSATTVFGDVQKGLGELSERTKEVYEVGKSIASLEDLLRAPKLRGGLGELLLERLLADTLPHDSYVLQYTFRNGKTVDAVIRLGGNLVPVDSKFPLEDFERLLKAESEEEQKSLRRQFARTIKRHVNEVAEYILPDEGTFDFALMYIPAENIYYEIVLKTQPFAEEGDLYPYFLERRIIPVSPNSFYAYLQAIALGLKGLHVERSAREIIGHLGRLQGDLEDFQNDYRILGRHLFDTARKYDEAQRKLSRFGDKLQLAGETSVEKSPEEEKGDPD